MRRIISKYSGKCRNCKTPHLAGDPVFWTKGVRGVLCESCAKTETIGKPLVSTPSNRRGHVFETASDLFGKETEWQIDWSELRDICLDVISGKSVCKLGSNNAEIAEAMQGGTWAGYTLPDVERWLRSGYQVPHLILGDPPVPIREKRRLVFREEGDEFHYDLAMSGDDNYFSEWTKRENIPGLSIVATIGFRGGVDQSVINAYLSWICRSVYSLEENGVDCQVSLAVETSGTFRGADYQTRRSIVRVKKENEISDFAFWSAILSPAGTRGFTFAARACNAEFHGKSVSSGMGSSRDSQWGVKFNSATRTLNITQDSTGRTYSFPEEDMTQKLHEALKETRKAS